MSAYRASRPLPLTDEERRQGIAWKIRLLPEGSSEKTNMGVIADTFRDRNDVVLGTGLHRVCAWGNDAEEHSKGYQHLADIGGLALLIGVDIDRCSSMHLCEKVGVNDKALALIDELWTPKEATTISDTIRQRYPSDIMIGPVHGWLDGDPWTNARDEADRRGLIKRGKVGTADCMLFKIVDVLRLLESVYLDGPFRGTSS